MKLFSKRLENAIVIPLGEGVGCLPLSQPGPPGVRHRGARTFLHSYSKHMGGCTAASTLCVTDNKCPSPTATHTSHIIRNYLHEKAAFSSNLSFSYDSVRTQIKFECKVEDLN